jgi:probable rRNA maturation factor
MILLDTDLDPDPAPPLKAVKRTSAPAESVDQRLPTTRALARFLAEAQAVVRLRGQVTVLLTSDETIRSLNRRFRGKNKATDVLSFPADIAAPGPEKIAGDLAIGVPTARRQAAGQGHSLSTEIRILILHGLLHLAGHDHEADSGEMARRERLLRAQLGLPEGLIERTTLHKRSASPRTAVKSSASPKAAVLKGHGFSRAVKIPPKTAALAAEGKHVDGNTVLGRSKPRPSLAAAKVRRP